MRRRAWTSTPTVPPKRERGTRPTGPRPWPTAALAARQEAVDLAADIVRLAQRAKVAPQANIYLTRQTLAEIEAHAERQQRLLNDALHGAAADPTIAALVEELAELRARVAELEATHPPLRLVPPRQAER